MLHHCVILLKRAFSGVMRLNVNKSTEWLECRSKSPKLLDVDPHLIYKYIMLHPIIFNKSKSKSPKLLDVDPRLIYKYIMLHSTKVKLRKKIIASDTS